ncbi:MAG: redox-regulated ATPase YchF, partial [Bacteroidetes bacterium SW_10_40_5]
SLDLDKEAFNQIQELQLLTQRPVLYLANVAEDDIEQGNQYVDQLKESIQDEEAELMTICAKIESEIAEMESEEERKEYLGIYGLEEPGVNILIHKAYSLLDLITFFTAGKKEVKAWPLKKGLTAPQAAGQIHSDFQRGFIKAEVISYEDYVHYGSETTVKEAGKMRMEGKSYIVKDGDVIHFKFNV